MDEVSVKFNKIKIMAEQLSTPCQDLIDFIEFGTLFKTLELFKGKRNG